ncbi:MAG TPA: NUDIX hydrolase [bacterium]|nr:NUDIX hydrolase [bacterium]HPN42385.1 NUDIX hydrolase [bacterium]
MSDHFTAGDRQYPVTPRLGVGVVVFDREKFLLVKRNQEPALGLWTVPGGLVELGETLETAAKREVAEECGLDVKLIDYIDYFEFIEVNDASRIKYHYVVIEFLALYTGGQLQAASDAGQANWFLRDEVSSISTTEKTIALLDKAIARYDSLKSRQN